MRSLTPRKPSSVPRLPRPAVASSEAVAAFVERRKFNSLEGRGMTDDQIRKELERQARQYACVEKLKAFDDAKASSGRAAVALPLRSKPRGPRGGEDDGRRGGTIRMCIERARRALHEAGAQQGAQQCHEDSLFLRRHVIHGERRLITRFSSLLASRFFLLNYFLLICQAASQASPHCLPISTASINRDPFQWASRTRLDSDNKGKPFPPLTHHPRTCTYRRVSRHLHFAPNSSTLAPPRRRSLRSRPTQ